MNETLHRYIATLRAALDRTVANRSNSVDQGGGASLGLSVRLDEAGYIAAREQVRACVRVICVCMFWFIGKWEADPRNSLPIFCLNLCAAHWHGSACLLLYLFAYT
jgi:hypothetical protein